MIIIAFELAWWSTAGAQIHLSSEGTEEMPWRGWVEWAPLCACVLLTCYAASPSCRTVCRAGPGYTSVLHVETHSGTMALQPILPQLNRLWVTISPHTAPRQYLSASGYDFRLRNETKLPVKDLSVR